MMYLIVHPMNKFCPILVTGQLSDNDAMETVVEYICRACPPLKDDATKLVDESTVIELDGPLTVIE